MEEPLEAYLDVFDDRRGVFENLLETTVDLTQLSEHSIEILTDPQLLEAFRYIAGPPISLDDLKVVANAPSLSSKSLQGDPSLAKRLIETVLLGLDRERFPWISEGREPREDEKRAAVLASAALVASQRVATDRRSEGKSAQEMLVETTLETAHFTKIAAREVNTLHDGPKPGEFCRECMLGSRKADILVGLWDRRFVPIECKVSNSSTNSIKRLNNDAAVKAMAWIKEFGANNVVPTAVLSGVYKLKHLVAAQDCGLTLFWAHNLSQMIAWIESTKRSQP